MKPLQFYENSKHHQCNRVQLRTGQKEALPGEMDLREYFKCVTKVRIWRQNKRVHSDLLRSWRLFMFLEGSIRAEED